VGGENRLKAERAWFLTEEVRRAKPETEQLLTRWGKSCVFSESTGLSFLKHTRRPISSASLGVRIEKAKPERSLLPFPCILPPLSGRESTYKSRLSARPFFRETFRVFVIYGKRSPVSFFVLA